MIWGREALSFGAAGLGYLLGSVPFGLLLTRAAGLDIRAVGSGNIGATNVLRTGRRGIAAGTLVLDGGKGALAVQAAALLLGAVWAPVAAFGAVLGHCFPVWLRFRGGKGVATGLGALLGLDWRVGGACCAVWVAAVVVTRRSSVGALAAFVAAPVLAAMVLPGFAWVVPLAIAVLVVARHHGNIRRLIEGVEPRIGGTLKS